MKILAIETSCDETAASIVENGTTIITNVVASSQKFHAKTGGIIPENAARQQLISIIPVLKEALGENMTKGVDALAVTVGPGLIGSLLVGVETARTLSCLWSKPIIPVNHVRAHLYANWIKPLNNKEEPLFPLIGLVVSGGHTDLVLLKNHNSIQLLGSTRDDAAGEAFDKIARILGLPYPGGPAIAEYADKFMSNNSDNRLTLFPRPMHDEDNFDWSFSGLKTAVSRYMSQAHPSKELNIEMIAAEVQEAIVDSLIKKTINAINLHKPKSFLISGGVAANSRLKEKFEHALKSIEFSGQFFAPEPKLCTDNAAAIASCAFFVHKTNSWKDIIANPQLTITESV